MIVTTRLKNQFLATLTGSYFIGLCLDDYPSNTDTWAVKPWTADQETTVAATNGVFDETTFQNKTNVKGFYIRDATDLLLLRSFEDVNITDLVLNPTVTITNVL